MLLPFGGLKLGKVLLSGGIQDFCVIFGQVVQTSRHLAGGGDPVRPDFRGHSIFVFKQEHELNNQPKSE